MGAQRALLLLRQLGSNAGSDGASPSPPLAPQEASTIRDRKAAAAYEAETALFRNNPYPDIVKGDTLPPNAGEPLVPHVSQ